MRLMRLGEPGTERPVVRVDADHYVDVSDVISDYDESFFADGMDELRGVFARRCADGEVRGFAGERVGPPIARPHQILCIGLNYRDHAEETGQAIPEEPILFTKPPNTLVGPFDDVRIPRAADAVDW
ncbi:MAG: fumarylacetoacetate hydrolase family protein, partial [Myxococcota bacterium]